MVRTALDKFKDVAELVKSTDVYDIHDLKLEHMIISTTRLHSGKETRGHTHADKEEVYICLEGSGKLQVGEELVPFVKGDLVTIPLGAFHKAFNDSESDLIFLCVFEKYERG